MADLHVHSTFSDGRMTVAQLVDFYGERGFGAIAITDHICEYKSIIGLVANYMGRSLTQNTFSNYLETIKKEARRARQQYNMLVIPGFELSKNHLSNHRSAHILALGVSKYISADLPIIEQLEMIREQGASAIAAHPVSTRVMEKQTFHLWNSREQLRPYFDAWEVASGPHLFQEVLTSGLPMIATSDLHHPKQITAWKTVFNCERNVEAVLHAIRTQQVQFHFYQDGIESLKGLNLAYTS